MAIHIAPIRIDGVRVETSDRDASYTDEGVPELMSFTKVVFRLFGTGFTEKTVITITEVKNQYGGPCILPAAGQFRAIAGSIGRNTMLVEILMPKSDTYFYFCTKTAEEEGASLVGVNLKIKKNISSYSKETGTNVYTYILPYMYV